MLLRKFMPLFLLILCACESQKPHVVVLDFGSHATPKIAQRLGHFSIPHVILDGQESVETILKYNPKAVILSGGPASVYQPGSPKADIRLYEMGIPLLGICYGMQLMAQQLGGQVSSCKRPESKKIVPVHVDQDSPLHQKSHTPIPTWMYHQDCVEIIPEGFQSLGFTQDTKIAMFYHPEKQFYGVQFHPERIDKTREGVIFLDRFIFSILQDK